jgi:DinB superfamily
MKPTRIFGLAVLLVLCMSAVGQVENTKSAAAPQDHPPISLACTVNNEISDVEKLVLEASEAMPEKKYNFSPFKLKTRRKGYNGVPTFGEEVKHIATINYSLWSPLVGNKLPACLAHPLAITSKSDAIEFLKSSFALGHKAAATLTAKNMMDPVTVGNSKSTRLLLTTFAIAHAYDHYGKMVEYLRMNGIVTPDSSGISD